MLKDGAPWALTFSCSALGEFARRGASLPDSGRRAEILRAPLSRAPLDRSGASTGAGMRASGISAA
eukprot:8715750-Pyramimonas_sp.AAC.1